MSGKPRVHELAKELGVPAKEVLVWLKKQGEFVKSAKALSPVPSRPSSACGISGEERTGRQRRVPTSSYDHQRIPEPAQPGRRLHGDGSPPAPLCLTPSQ